MGIDKVNIGGSGKVGGSSSVSGNQGTAGVIQAGRDLLSSTVGALYTDFKKTVDTVAQTGNVLGAIADASKGSPSNLGKVLGS